MPKNFNWRSGFNRNLILSRIDGDRKVDGQRCSFSPGEDYYFWLPVLNSAINAHPEVGLLKTSCVKQSLSDASLKLNDPDAFLVRCDQAFANLSKRPKSKFVFYSTVTYKGPKVFDWISDGPFRIYWQPNDKGRFVRAALRAREDLSFKRRAHKIPDDNDELTTLLAHVTAYDVSDAFEKANDCIDRFRGMLAGQIIFFCVMNGSKFKTQNELNEFLDLPMDQKKLKRRQQLMKYFLEYQNRS
jgi:hypothetical protein